MKSQSYKIFWQRIHRVAKNNGFPLRVMFELTYRCNFYCRHCYVPENYRKKKGELNTKDIFSILKQLKDIGCFYLGFTGGEPFVREDILDILKYAKRCGFEIIIYTNGSLIDECVAKELKRLRPNKVDITIPAMTEDAFGRITGINGACDKVFKAIELLYKNGINLGFKSCVLKENASQIQKIENFAHSLGAQHRLDDMLSPCLDGSKQPYKYRGTFLDTNSHESKTNLRECSDSKDTRVNSSVIREDLCLFRCGVGRTQAAITPLGELKMCLMIDYPRYKILDTSFKDCWQRLKNLVDNIRPDENYKCSACELKDFCKWCPGKSWLEKRDFISCVSECQYWAKLRRQAALSKWNISIGSKTL
jgi:radical SAM protein with 4Fe4S-binding SPASM domain